MPDKWVDVRHAMNAFYEKGAIVGTRQQERQFRPTTAVIDMDAFAGNVRQLRAKARPGCRFMAVVKADAYGHGACAMAKCAIEAGADFLGVALLEEAVELRNAGISAPALVMGPSTPDGAKVAVWRDISLTVFERDVLHALQDAAKTTGKRAKAHLKIDTGMHRIGVESEGKLCALLEEWKNCPDVEMEGVFSHFAKADDDEAFSHEQIERFMAAVTLIQEAGFDPIRHLCNTAGLLWLPEAHLDMVRCGIGLYGYSPNPERATDLHLAPVMRLETKISRVFDLAAGECVGYGGTYCATEPRRIATLPIGYGDGFKRGYSPDGHVLLRGEIAPVAGRICMDQCMIDVTDIPGAGVGDAVVLLGTQGERHIDADDWARQIGSISYEVLLSVSARMPRRFVGEASAERK